LLSLPRVTEDPVEDPKNNAVIVQHNEPPVNNFLEEGNRSHLFVNLSKKINLPANVTKTLRKLAMRGATNRTNTQRFVPFSRIPQDILNTHQEALLPHSRHLNVTYKVGGSPIQNKHVLLGHYFNGETLQPAGWYHLRNPISESNANA
jgi:hypothetical protein